MREIKTSLKDISATLVLDLATYPTIFNNAGSTGNLSIDRLRTNLKNSITKYKKSETLHQFNRNKKLENNKKF